MGAASRPSVDSVDEALAAVLRPGQRILIAQGDGQPRELTRALARHRDRLASSQILVGLLFEDLPKLPETHVETFYPAGALGTRAGLEASGARYLRNSLYELSAGMHSGAIPVDVVLAQATAAVSGRHSLGSTVDLTVPAIEHAEATVLEVAMEVPWTGERSTVAASSERLVVAARSAPVRIDRAPRVTSGELAAAAVEWIPDGATIELGIGGWAAELTRLLAHRRDLRVHSGALGDWVMFLHAAGALRPGVPVVAADLGGSAQFYRALPELVGLDLAPAYLTHDPAMLAILPRFRAVNSAFEVDLEGRANCEVGPGGRLAGIAGLRDFARGAAAAPDGLSILVLSSEGRGSSRVVPRLPGDRVSLEADMVDVVVTEHGSAYLRGLSPSERAQALISCAHPRYRAWLKAALDDHITARTSEG